MCFSLDCPPAKRHPKPGKPSKLQEYRRRWHKVPYQLRQQFRAAYGHDRERYMSSYEPDDEDFMCFQELGMEGVAFVKRRLLRRMRLEPYWYTGAQAMKFSGAALAGDTSITAAQSNIIFVSLDVEDNPQDPKQSMAELGIASLHSSQLSSENDSGITGFNYALKKHKNRKFLFGNTTRPSLEILGSTIVEHFSQLRRQDPRCEIILLFHGTINEIRIMDDLGVSLEALTVTGIADTCSLPSEIVGSKGSPESLLAKLPIPTRADLLHCAGNDAHYTLQALLALLQAQ